MPNRTDALKRALAGTDVLGALALLLLTAGLPGGSPVVNLGAMLAAAGRQSFPVLSAVPADLLVVAGVYVQAVGVAALYRIARDGTRALQERAETAGSA